MSSLVPPTAERITVRPHRGKTFADANIFVESFVNQTAFTASSDALSLGRLRGTAVVVFRIVGRHAHVHAFDRLYLFEETTALSISVMIPTYRRPQDLRRCLEAVVAQSLPPDEIIVIVRDSDTATWELLQREHLATGTLCTVTVTEPGQVQALNAGLKRVKAEFVAITDDDAAPHRDWTARIVEQFAASPEIGGVGGRDYLHVGGQLQDGRERVVGKVPVFGKHIGNHHLGFGQPREVDNLKGVNGAYRTQAIRPIGFDTRLRGTGAQVYWEISLGIALKRAGWKLIYDPRIAVDHYLAPRFDEDQRNAFNSLAMQNAAYNEALIRMTHVSPFERIAFLGWAVLVGTRASPGVVQWVRFLPREGWLAGAKLFATLKGRSYAWRDTWQREKSRAEYSR